MVVAVLVNAGRLDFDAQLDLTRLREACSGGLRRFEADPSPEEIAQRAEGADVLVTKEIPVTATTIERLPACVRLILEAGTGFNNIDLEAARTRGIAVCNCPAYSSEAVAHLTITFLLSLSCSLGTQMRSLGAGSTEHFTAPMRLPNFELAGKTIGLVGGAGSIGSCVARLAEAFGLKVLIASRSNRPGAVPLDQLLQASDFVSLHCPLSKETRHMISEEQIALMKPTAYLINTSRGGLVDEPALASALSSRRIAGAALDVQEVEPPAEDNPLYGLDNVILTPHIGWKRLETRQRLVDLVADGVASFGAGKPANVVA